jgi:hypothetical protein
MICQRGFNEGYMTRWICLFCLFLGVFKAASQEDTFHTWSDFNYQHNFNTKFSFKGDAGIRGVLSSSDWSILYIRPGFHYQVNPEISVSASVSGFNTWNRDLPNSFEFRYAPEAAAVWPSFKVGSFSHRTRYEGRFFWYQTSGDDPDAPTSDQNSRFRYQLSFKTDYFNIAERLNNFFVQVSTEFFLPFGDDATEIYFNQNRFILALGQLLAKGWSYKVDIMWQRSKNTLEGNFNTNEMVIRLRIYLKSQNID